MTAKINVNSHSSIQINDFFFDPYNITDNLGKAKAIFLTHTHYDHLSIEDINKIVSKETIFVATKDAKSVINENYKDNKKIFVSPNEKFELLGATVETFPAYNLDKSFHKKEFGWVGYKLTINGETFAVVGDSDKTNELEQLKCDVLFVPIGGTYTMNGIEAAALTNIIKPRLVIPTHYNAIVGTKKDEKEFLSHLDKSIAFKIFL